MGGFPDRASHGGAHDRPMRRRSRAAVAAVVHRPGCRRRDPRGKNRASLPGPSPRLRIPPRPLCPGADRTGQRPRQDRGRSGPCQIGPGGPGRSALTEGRGWRRPSAGRRRCRHRRVRRLVRRRHCMRRRAVRAVPSAVGRSEGRWPWRPQQTNAGQSYCHALQHATCNMQHPTCNMQHPTCTIHPVSASAHLHFLLCILLACRFRC